MCYVNTGDTKHLIKICDIKRRDKNMHYTNMRYKNVLCKYTRYKTGVKKCCDTKRRDKNTHYKNMLYKNTQHKLKTS